MELMKASIAHGIRPTALVLGKDSKKPWGPWDILLAKAYQRFINETCQQCGLPKYICHNEDSRIQFKIGRDSCEATAAAEREQKRMADDKSKVSYGVRVYGDPYLTDEAKEQGLEFSDFRRGYLIEQAKRNGLITEEEAARVSGNLP